MSHNKPVEYWKVVVYYGDAKDVKVYYGKGGRKRAFEYAALARRKKENLISTEVFSCIPVWTLAERWEP